MGKDSVTILKKGAPKLKDVKDFDRQINIPIESLEALKVVFDAAIPQLGRELAKSNYYYSRKSALEATSVAADASLALDIVGDNSYHAQCVTLALQAGYDADNWTVTDKCGTTKSFDWRDLYEDNLEVEVVVHMSRKVKDHKELAKAGLK